MTRACHGRRYEGDPGGYRCGDAAAKVFRAAAKSLEARWAEFGMDRRCA